MTNDLGRWQPGSLALRITLVVSLTLVIVFAASAWIVSQSIEQHFEELDFGELQAVAESLDRALTGQPQRDRPTALQVRLAQAVAGHHGVYFGVLDSDQRWVFARAPQALLDVARRAAVVPTLSPDRLVVWTVGADTFRGSLVAIEGHKALVAVSTDAHEHYLARLRRGLWGGALMATALAVLAVCFAVRWGHAPIRRMSAAVRGITSENLHVRLDRNAVPRELFTLVASFNEMLDQLQTSFDRLTQFSADIAHELRTPVTNLMTQAQVALSKDRPAASYRDVLYSSLDELDRLRKMISEMLFMAQTENPKRQFEKVKVHLDDEIRVVFEYFEALSDEAGIELRLEQAPGGVLEVYGDRDMLQRAISNLLSNALRHTEHGETIVIRLVNRNGSVCVEVCNPGPAIEATHLPHLFERFYRVDPARNRDGEGTGLGLAIVKTIAKVHGGSVGVHCDGGLNRFWMCLPVTQVSPGAKLIVGRADREPTDTAKAPD